MPHLAGAKHRIGSALGNHTLVADSAETAFCAFTSAATLLGVGLNTWLAGGRPTPLPHSSSPHWQSKKTLRPGKNMTSERAQARRATLPQHRCA
jgi:hypothetical protein